jgi:hypothetical protein
MKTFVLSVALVALFGIGCDSSGFNSSNEKFGSTAKADGVEQPTPEPSAECNAAAQSAVQVLESVSHGADVEIVKAELVDAYSDAELIRITFQRNGVTDSYLVSTESMGGSPCFVYGLQLKSQQIDLEDQGESPMGSPSEACTEASRAVVEQLEAVNGHAVTITNLDLVDGFSDRELIRASITNHYGQADSYLINAETYGGSPCLIYGLQLKSEQMDLQDQ